MAKQKTIMVVDDEEDTRETLKTILEKNNYNIVLAVNAEDCMKKLPRQKVDLILLDIMMPGKPIREIIPKIKGVKIVYLTAIRISEAERERLLKEKNIVDFITKPFDMKSLLNKIKKLTR